jgi:hypothetical protein
VPFEKPSSTKGFKKSQKVLDSQRKLWYIDRPFKKGIFIAVAKEAIKRD